MTSKERVLKVINILLGIGQVTFCKKLGWNIMAKSKRKVTKALLSVFEVLKFCVGGSRKGEFLC